MQSNQISPIELAENIAKMQVSQNNAILQELMFPTPNTTNKDSLRTRTDRQYIKMGMVTSKESIILMI